MIGFLRGEIASISEDKIIIDVNGIGFNVYMPAGQISLLSGIGNEIKVYTYMNVREDAMTLYGFLNSDDLSFFKLLIGVSGVGPKFALGLLSTFNVNELRMAILSMDAKTISKSPGIGIKSAQKIILELKDKVQLKDIIKIETSDNYNCADAVMTEAMQDAVEALTTLGYSATDSLRAVRECGAGPDDDFDTVIKNALKLMKR